MSKVLKINVGRKDTRTTTTINKQLIQLAIKSSNTFHDEFDPNSNTDLISFAHMIALSNDLIKSSDIEAKLYDYIQRGFVRL